MEYGQRFVHFALRFALSTTGGARKLAEVILHDLNRRNDEGAIPHRPSGRRTGGYQSLPNWSPRLGVRAAHQVRPETRCDTNRTLPSPNAV